MPRDFLILHAELNVYCMREHTQQILHIHEDTFHYSLHSFQH